jgi:hypothetical protein
MYIYICARTRIHICKNRYIYRYIYFKNIHSLVHRQRLEALVVEKKGLKMKLRGKEL